MVKINFLAKNKFLVKNQFLERKKNFFLSETNFRFGLLDPENLWSSLKENVIFEKCALPDEKN